MTKLLLFCLEAKNPKTEIDFFKSIVDNNRKYINIEYLDQERINSIELSKMNVLKLKQVKLSNGDKKLDCEIICFCDGDIDENQMKSIKNTYNLIIDFFNIKTNIISKEFLYDKGFSFEFFIWHITEKYDSNFFNENKNNIKEIRTRYRKDLVEIYKKYHKDIRNINDIKKYSKIIWKPIIDYNYKDNKDHIQIVKNILEKFNKQETQNSIYFKILSKIIDKHNYKEKKLKN